MTAYQAKDMPTELELLVTCSRTVLSAALVEKLGALVKAKPDWERVLYGARYHGVTPLVCRHLSLYGAVPAAVQTELSSYSRRNTVHNLLLSSALLELLSTLKEQGVTAVPYKGPVLAAQVYGDVSLRSSKDLDVIVKPKDFGQAATILETLGYTPTNDDPNGHFHTGFVHSKTGVMLELHHNVLRRSVFWTPLTVKKLWPRLCEVSFLGQQVTSFSLEDTLLLLCLHGSSHAWQGLTWICDVAEYVRAHPTFDWQRFLQTAKRARLLRMTLLGLKLAHDVLDAPLPEDVLQTLNADPKLQTLSQTIMMRMYEQNIQNEATLTYRLQQQMRSGLWWLPLYGRLVKKQFTKRFRLQMP